MPDIEQKRLEKRARPIQKILRFDQEELDYIKQRMDKVGIKNFNHFTRELLIKGEVKVIDFKAIKELRLAVNRIGVNINQTVKAIHENNRANPEQVEQLLTYQKELLVMVNDVIMANVKDSELKGESKWL